MIVCERVHAVWITYFEVSIYILVQQYIFHIFRAAIHISERQYIFQSGNIYFRAAITYFRAALHISEEAVCTQWERRARTVWGRRVRYQAGQDPVWAPVTNEKQFGRWDFTVCYYATVSLRLKTDLWASNIHDTVQYLDWITISLLLLHVVLVLPLLFYLVLGPG